MVKNLSANEGDGRGRGSVPGLGRFPGEGMARHSSLLAWGISWTEEPGGLQSIGLQSIGHYWSDLACTYIMCIIYVNFKERKTENSRFCSKKRVGWTLMPVGIYDWLIWKILWAGRELKPFTQRQAHTMLDLQDKEGCLAIELYQWE